MKVDVYYNLHKECLSVRHKGLVVLHPDYALIQRAKLVVQPAGRRRVRREKKKNVHAFIRGEFVPVIGPPTSWMNTAQSIHYNPYHNKTFVDKDNKPVYSATYVFVEGKNIWGWGLNHDET